MKISNLKDVAPERRLLSEPIVIVLETFEELLMANKTFGRSIHHREVLEDSREQRFNSTAYSMLDDEIRKRGGYPQTKG